MPVSPDRESGAEVQDDQGCLIDLDALNRELTAREHMADAIVPGHTAAEWASAWGMTRGGASNKIRRARDAGLMECTGRRATYVDTGMCQHLPVYRYCGPVKAQS